MHRDELLLDRARRLRQDMTDAEKRLWFRLRRRQVGGHRFRRQVPIGTYIADFACLASRLVVELDGGQHNELDQETLDVKRTDWFETRGYRVLRFWNYEALGEMDGVMEAISNALSPSPASRRAGVGGDPSPFSLPRQGEGWVGGDSSPFSLPRQGEGLGGGRLKPSYPADQARVHPLPALPLKGEGIGQEGPARRSTSVTIPSRILSPASQNPGSVMSIPRRLTSWSGRIDPPAPRKSR
jgi:very-short-patch-repair endonuclease